MIINKAVLLCSLVCCVFSVHLPPEIPRCKRSDPNFKKCLRSTADITFKVFAKGNKELGVPPLDPLRFPEVSAAPVPGPINMFQKYTDIVLVGSSTGIVNDFDIDFDHCTIWLNHTLRPMKASSNYVLKGQLLLLPVDAHGTLKAVLENFEINIRARCEKFKKNQAEYLRVTSADMKFTPSGGKYDFGSLVNGNPQLDEELHKVINDNPVDFFEVVKPTTEALWRAATIDIMNRVFTKVPLNELFED